MLDYSKSKIFVTNTGIYFDNEQWILKLVFYYSILFFYDHLLKSIHKYKYKYFIGTKSITIIDNCPYN